MEEVTAAAARASSPVWEHSAMFTQSGYAPSFLQLRHKYSVCIFPDMAGPNDPLSSWCGNLWQELVNSGGRVIVTGKTGPGVWGGAGPIVVTGQR